MMKLTAEDIAYLRRVAGKPDALDDEMFKRVQDGLLIRVLGSVDPCNYPQCGCRNLCMKLHDHSNPSRPCLPSAA